MIESGVEFPFGPPVGMDRKLKGMHRDAAIPKLAPRIELYAKKLRDLYHREGSFTENKIYIEPLRAR